MSQITVSGGQFLTYKGGQGTLKLRIYARKTFVTSDLQIVVKYSLGGDQFYKEVACTVNGSGVVSHAGFTIDSTVDGIPDTSKYAFILFTDEGNALGKVYRHDLVIPLTTPTTLAAIANYNEALPIIMPNTTYYTAAQIDALFAALVNMATKANENSYGATRLSLPAANIYAPIVVGDNDPRLTPAIQPKATEVIYGATRLSLAAANINMPIAVGDNDSRMTFVQSGSGAVTRTLQNKLRDVVNVADFGVSTASANNAAALALAIAATPTNGTLVFPAGVFYGYLLIWRGDITIQGAGSGSTILKLPNSCPNITVPYEPGGTITGLPNVIELGSCALGNTAPAYSNVTIKGLTVDGNTANNTAPTVDVFGHGLIATNTSKLIVSDFVAKNCFLTGVDLAINSNYANVTARVENCGVAALNYPNFDVNSSKYGVYTIISIGGKYGGRLLDNCYGNILNISVYAPSVTGFVYNNQAANSSWGNTLNVTVIDGCATGQGMLMGSNCYGSIINLACKGVAGHAFYAGASTLATAPRGNKIFVSSYLSGYCSVVENIYSLYNQYFINSRLDGRTGASGSSFALDLNGSYGQFTVNVEDSATAQVRGIVFRAGATNNHIIDFVHNTIVGLAVTDQDTSDTNKNFRYVVVADKRVAFTYTGTWNNASAPPLRTAGYMKDALGVVRLMGTVSAGTAGTAIATLPVGFRPTAKLLFATISGGAIAEVTVDTAGVIAQLSGVNTGINLESIQFLAY